MFTGPNIVKDGLVLALDAANTKSYSGTGTTWYDLSGNGYNGTLTNGTTFDNVNNGSISFDGVDDYVTSENSVRVGGKNTNVSVEVCMYLPTDGGGTIVSNERQSTDVGHGLYICSNSQIRFTQHSNRSSPYSYHTYASQDSVNKLKINDWNYISWSVSIGSSTISCSFLVNGYTETSNSNIVWSGTENPNHDNLDIGRWRNHTYGTGYSKSFKLANLRIYSRLLTLEEQIQNYNATKQRFGL